MFLGCFFVWWVASESVTLLAQSGRVSMASGRGHRDKTRIEAATAGSMATQTQGHVLSVATREFTLSNWFNNNVCGSYACIVRNQQLILCVTLLQKRVVMLPCCDRQWMVSLKRQLWLICCRSLILYHTVQQSEPTIYYRAICNSIKVMWLILQLVASWLNSMREGQKRCII